MDWSRPHTPNIGARPGWVRFQSLPYIPALDGLRAIAVIAVLLYHAGLPLPGGFLGVESFFVLSGYLITEQLLREWWQRGHVSLTRFWMRRARRLLPALFLLLASTLLYTYLAQPWKIAEVRGDVLAALTYVMNWHLVFSGQSYFDAALRPPLLQHLWSLAVEEQFYLLWPLLFAAGMRYVRPAGLLLLTLALATASSVLMALLYHAGSDPSRIYYGTDTHATGLLVGAALALVWTPRRAQTAISYSSDLALSLSGILALAGLTASFIWLFAQHPLLYRGGFVLVDLCTALAILAVTHPRAQLVPRMLGCRPLRWIGLRSYGIYLWHWPVFQLTRPYLDVPLDGWPLLMLRFAIVGVLSEVSYRFVELPVRQGALTRTWRTGRDMMLVRSRELPQQRQLLVALTGMLLLASVLWVTRVAAPRTAISPSHASGTVGQAQAPGSRIAASKLSRPLNSAATRSAVEASIPTPVSTTSSTAQNSPPAANEVAPPASSAPPTVSPTTVGPVPLDAALVAKLQNVLDATVANGFVPGTVVSVSIPGYLPWNGASGVADRTGDLPMEPDTLVHIASITKMFTAVVVLQLADEGKLDLDAPISNWLPNIVLLADTTTVRDLLSHRSGLFDYLEDAQFFVPAYQDPERSYTPAELVAMANKSGAAFKPGTEGAWQYASTNYVILGMLVEKVTGHSLAEEMRRRIFDPLALKHTFFAPDEAPKGTLAQGYIDASDRANVSMTFVFATGNIISTADDVRRFVEALFSGKLLSGKALEMMTTMNPTGGAYGMPELQYGLGLMEARLNVGPRADGTPRPDTVSTVFGHIGGIAGFRSAVWRVPASGITIALSLNQADIDPNLLARDVLKTILAWQGQ